MKYGDKLNEDAHIGFINYLIVRKRVESKYKNQNGYIRSKTVKRIKIRRLNPHNQQQEMKSKEQPDKKNYLL